MEARGLSQKPVEASGIPQMPPSSQITNGRRQISPPRTGFGSERDQMFQISYFWSYFCSKNHGFKGGFREKKDDFKGPTEARGSIKKPFAF